MELSVRPHWQLKESHVTKHSVLPGADKSLARPWRKQARKHVRDARDFNNIDSRAVTICFFCKARRQKKFTPFREKTLACLLPGRAKD